MLLRARDALHPWPTAAANEANDYIGRFYWALGVCWLLVSAVKKSHDKQLLEKTFISETTRARRDAGSECGMYNYKNNSMVVCLLDS